MDQPSPEQITLLLRRAASGEGEAANALAPLVMSELRAIAARALRRERPGHTLQPTALADEAFVRLVGDARISWEDRSHFFGFAASAMRRLLVDHARARACDKRGGGAQRVALEDAQPAAPSETSLDLLALDDALTKLEELAPRQGRIVELRYFGGLTSEQIAGVLGVSVRTVDGEWAMARAWLRTQLMPA